ncbi:MAG: gamma-glutamyltransferase [Gemmatimonadales bacterium]|nr:gamma-glutamyltransferase [Gemmatimonadales bacterium]
MSSPSRRRFLAKAAGGLVATGLPATPAAAAAGVDTETLPRIGMKPVARDKRAAASSSHPIVTRTMLDVLRAGGNAADAVVAGSLMSATVEPHMTNHGGCVTCLYWDAKTQRPYALNSTGTIVPGLPPFRVYPPGLGGFAAAGRGAMGVIPGFVPGLGQVHRRFGSRPWAELCQPSARLAEEGHPVHGFEYLELESDKPSTTYLPEGRELFMPGGFLPQVGDRFRNPALARTMERLGAEGPDYFTTGEWGRKFVAEANRLGWRITQAHMTEVPPRWQEPLRYRIGNREVVQLPPPEKTGAASAFFLGLLEQMEVGKLGAPATSAESLYLVAHALRWVDWEIGRMQDPTLFDVPIDIWLSKEHQAHVAAIIKRGQPKIDLTEHVKLTAGRGALAAAGMGVGESPAGRPEPSLGSCELSVVDEQGNWAQVLNTMQTGGIPGAVVDGVPMTGSHVDFGLTSVISGWLTGGGRVSLIAGNTFILADGKPIVGLGTPGTPNRTVPQVLANILFFGMDPYQASLQPRCWPLEDGYGLSIEARLPAEVVTGLARKGIQVKPLAPYEWRTGSFQVCWRDPASGRVNASTDPRRAGWADGI